MSVQIPIVPYDIAVCHYLPSNGIIKDIIVKYYYNHQRDIIWQQRSLFFDPQLGKDSYQQKIGRNRLGSWQLL